MTNEIATQDEYHTDLSLMPPAPPLSQQTRTAIARQVLRDHAELSQMAWDFATKLCGTKMVPVRFRNAPEEATAAILYGAELGMGPISALQNIFEVHGSPGIYARTAQALLEAKGYLFKTIEHTNTACKVYGWKPGRDPEADEPDETSRFTIEDAITAGWAPEEDDSERGGIRILGVRYRVNSNGKLAGNEKYIRQPRQMLWAKSMMETCRHLSPATLLGIAYSVEELESEASAPNPISGGSTAAQREAPLTVEEILSAPKGEPERPASPVDEAALAAEVAGKAREDAVLDAAEDDGDDAGPDDDGPQDAEVVEPEPEAPPVEPTPEPPAPAKRAPAKATGKRAAAKEQREEAKKVAANDKAATKKLPKEAADRVNQALANARAAQQGGDDLVPSEPENGPEDDGHAPNNADGGIPFEDEQAFRGSSTAETSTDPSEDDEAYAAMERAYAAMERARDAELADQADAEAAAEADAEAPDPAPAPGDDPAWVNADKDAVNADVDARSAATSAALADLQQQVADQEAAKATPAANPEPERIKAPQNWDGAKPATREQLQELAGCIAAAGFKPTPEGKAQWFAWLSQEVEREITANNKLSRSEIDRVIESMKADQQSS